MYFVGAIKNAPRPSPYDILSLPHSLFLSLFFFLHSSLLNFPMATAFCFLWVLRPYPAHGGRAHVTCNAGSALCPARHIPDEWEMLRLLSCLILHTHRISIFSELLDYTVYENICCSGMCMTYLIFSSHIINTVSKNAQTHWFQRGGLKETSRSNENLCFGFWLWLFFF